MAKKKQPKQVSIEQFEAEYRLLVPVAEQLRLELAKPCSKLLDNEGISLGFPLESRVKSWDSIINKLERLPTDIAEMRELNDLVGLRLILVFRRDLEIVCNHLRLCHSRSAARSIVDSETFAGEKVRKALTQHAVFAV